MHTPERSLIDILQAVLLVTWMKKETYEPGFALARYAGIEHQQMMQVKKGLQLNCNGPDGPF